MDRDVIFKGIVVAVAATLAACAGQPEPVPTRSLVSVPVTTPGHNVAELAVSQIGRPYRYGGADPSLGFDCSGLVFYTFSSLGLEVPRTSQEQFKAAKKIALSNAGHGDLVFFQDQAKLSHVGIYLGEGRFVHAPATGRSVSIADLSDPYYQRHLVAVGRLLPE